MRENRFRLRIINISNLVKKIMTPELCVYFVFTKKDVENIFDNFGLSVPTYKTIGTQKLYWEFLLRKVRVSRNQELIKWIIMTATKSITAQVEEVFEHPAVNTCSIWIRKWWKIKCGSSYFPFWKLSRWEIVKTSLKCNSVM